MTRRRARKSTQEMIERSYFPGFSNLLKIWSVGNATLSNGTTAFVGTITYLHPNYGVGNSSILDSKNLGLLGSSTTNNFVKQAIKKAHIKLTFDNLNGIAVRVNIIPVSSFGSTTIGSNSIITLDNHKNVRSFLLAKAGVTGSNKIITMDFEPWKIEGFSSFQNYVGSQVYWATATAVGSQFSGYYIQAYTTDVTSHPSSGINVIATNEYEVLGLQENLAQSA